MEEAAEEVPLVDVKTSAPFEEDQPSSAPSTKCFPGSASKILCCTFRVRVVGIVALLLLQILLIGYYHFFSGYYVSKLKYPSIQRDHNSATVLGNSTTAMKDAVLANTTRIINVLSDSTNTVTNASSKVSFHSTMSTTTSPSDKTVSFAPDGSIPLQCPPEPPNLQGRLAITFDKPPNTFEQTHSDNPLVDKGGHGKPPLCVARHKVAIIIPYRDREEHLRYFTQYMHPTLLRQQVDYQIFIINQLGHGKFNRAKLMNIGYLEASKLYPFQCFAFHDVDLILEDDRSLYWCSDRPRHMSAGVDKFNYHLPYSTIFGGVTMLSKEHMENINGFSNEFWGWGGEDDDVYNRLKIKGYKIIRYPMDIARYKMIQHKREKGNEANPKRFELIRKTNNTYQNDGINTIKYKVILTEFHSTYTNITVDVMGPAETQPDQSEMTLSPI